MYFSISVFVSVFLMYGHVFMAVNNKLTSLIYKTLT